MQFCKIVIGFDETSCQCDCDAFSSLETIQNTSYGLPRHYYSQPIKIASKTHIVLELLDFIHIYLDRSAF